MSRTLPSLPPSSRPKAPCCACSEQLRREGKIARVGAVFAPKRIGASSLVAMAVPPEKLEIVAGAVNRFPEVTHNYKRDHRFNLWFVVTAGSEGRLQAALGAIGLAAGYPILALPLVKEFQLAFPRRRQTQQRFRLGCAQRSFFAADRARRDRATSGDGVAGRATPVHPAILDTCQPCRL